MVWTAPQNVRSLALVFCVMTTVCVTPQNVTTSMDAEVTLIQKKELQLVSMQIESQLLSVCYTGHKEIHWSNAHNITVLFVLQNTVYLSFSLDYGGLSKYGIN